MPVDKDEGIVMEGKQKIAIVVSHPIQHFCPQYVSFAKNEKIALKVFFASALGYKKYTDPGFKQEISWGNLQLDQFDHLFLNGEVIIPSNKNLDAPALEHELASFMPDLVIVYGYFQKLQRRARQWAIKNKVKLAYISDSELRHVRNPIKDFLKGFYIRQYFSRINYFLSVGDANEFFYKKYAVPEAKIKRMHFPIDIVVYEKAWVEREALRNKIRLQYGLDNSDIVMAVVGKLVPWKNQDHIIDSMLKLEQEGISTHLFMIGSGEMNDDWKRKATMLVKSKVHFTGFVNIEDLPLYYAATDIYIHPASLEPHSIAVSEAIYMGCPVIISDTCGSYGENDDVQPGKNGFVFTFGKTTELADQIKLLISNKQMRNEFGSYSHEISVNFQKQSHYGIMENLRKLAEAK